MNIGGTQSKHTLKSTLPSYVDALITHFHVQEKNRLISLCLQSTTFLSQMFCIN